MKMDNDFVFQPVKRKKIIISKRLRDALVTHDTTIIQQRIFIVILSALKEKQSLFISPKLSFLDQNSKQLSFDDQFDGWANEGLISFQIPMKFINEKRKMRNEAIHDALVELATIKSFRLKDTSIEGFQAVFFILNPKWNSRFVYFEMDKAVVKILFDLKPFFQVKSDLPYLASTPNTLRFLLFLLKYKKQGFLKKSFEKILKELCIPIRKYRFPAIFERDFLIPVKLDLDSLNDWSFNYSNEKGEFAINIYYTKNSVGEGEKFSSVDELKIYRALKYLRKSRNLSDQNMRVIKKFYEVQGYEEFSKKIKRKIEKKLQGDDFIKAVFEHLEKP